MAGVVGKHVWANAELAHGAFPLGVEIFVEDQAAVGFDIEPAIGLDLGIELTRTPAGVAQGHQALLRSQPHGDSAPPWSRFDISKIASPTEFSARL